MAYKLGDDSLRRGGRTLGVEFDIYWLSPGEVRERISQAGLTLVFWGGRPADADEVQPQGYLIARKD